MDRGLAAGSRSNITGVTKRASGTPCLTDRGAIYASGEYSTVEAGEGPNGERRCGDALEERDR